MTSGSKRGAIKNINAQRGFGFIQVKGEDDHFFHISKVRNVAFSALTPGTSVEFESQAGKKGLEAINVRRIEQSQWSPEVVVSKPSRAGQDQRPSATHQHQPTAGRDGRSQVRPATPVPPVKAPYSFVPIDIDGAVTGEVRFHHGAYPSDDSLDGCLRVEWGTKTPTIVGHDQVPVSLLRNEFPRDWIPAETKKALLPLRATWLAGKPVIWAGSSLKGMLRSAISSLLAAPMERVNERHYTYRPNLDQKAVGGRLVRKFGVVVSRDPLKVKLVDPTEVCFVSDDITHAELQAGRYVNVCSATERGRTMLRADQRGDSVRPAVHAWTSFLGGVSLHAYHHGADGKAGYASAFRGRRVSPHPSLAVDKSALAAATVISVPPGVEAQWLNSAKVMKNDTTGHRCDHPLDDKPWYPGKKDSFADLRVDDAIIVEVDGASGDIVTLGHYFNYRTAYADSVRQRRVYESGRFGMQDRPEVSVLPNEELGEDGGTLSGARLLFGYVEEARGPNGNPRLRSEGTPGDFSRLAGRIACNHALEQIVDGRERFVCMADGFWLALKELGSPKPSAVEHYLDQTDTSEAQPRAGSLLTYGDSYRLDGSTLKVENRAARLRGRKVFPHQEALNVKLDHCMGKHEPKSAENPGGPILENGRALLARHVSSVGIVFKSSIHYCDLRPWELGALLAAVEPGRFAKWLATHLKQEDFPKTVKQLQPNNPNPPEFASKLGHARPLGLGSVQGRIVGLDEACWDRCHGALWTRLKSAAPGNAGLDLRLASWFRAHRFSDTKTLDYPTAEVEENLVDRQPKIPVQRTYGHHTKLRRLHAESRRKKAAEVLISGALLPLDELP